MKTRTLLLLGALALGLHLHLNPAQAATVVWTGGGDGVSWNNAANWSNNVLPGVSDDAVMNGVGTNVTITIGSDVTVQSVQCSASLNLSAGSLSLTKGASQVAGNFLIAAGLSLNATGSNTTFVGTGPTTIDGANFTLSSGAVVTLPSVRNCVADCGSPNWNVSGSNSVLSLPALTNLMGSACSYPVIQATGGGQIRATNLLNLVKAPLTVLADGAGSLVDLRGLWSASGEGGYLLSFVAQNGGTVWVPQLPGGVLVAVTLNPGGLMPTAQFRQLDTLSVAGVAANFSNLTSVGSLSLSGVAQSFPALTTLGGLTISGLPQTFPGVTNCDGANFTVNNGAVVTLPSVRNCVANCGSPNWTVGGLNSVLSLPALTNLTGSACSYPVIQATGGGQILATNLLNLAKAPLTVLADGAGSLVDFRGLRSASGQGGYLLSFVAQNGGTIWAPQFQGGPLVGVTLDPSGVMPTAQLQQLAALTLPGVSGNFASLTALGGLTISGVTQNFPAVTNCDGANFSVNGGAVVTLPALRNYDKLCSGPDWTVSGSNSMLSLPALTNMTGAVCGYHTMQATAGGQLLATNLGSINVAPVTLLADGAGSLVDLRGLRTAAGQGDYLLSFVPQNGGTIWAPQFQGGPLVGVTLNPGGVMPTAQLQQLATLTLPGVSGNFASLTTLAGLTISGVTQSFPALTNCDGANFTLSSGAVVTLPSVQNCVANCGSPNWSVSGSNSVLSLPALTNLSGVVCGFPVIQATGGGQILATNLLNVAKAPLTVQADGAGSLVDFRGLRSASGQGGYLLSYVAQNGGTVKCSSCGVVNGVSFSAMTAGMMDLSLVQGISGGSCAILADGTGSVIDLSSLSAFATPLGASSLTAQNGGVILLPGSVFLLVNVAVNIPSGNPVLPPVVSAGAAVSLYGKAWHSYWVEARDTRDPASGWSLFKRVPQTNDLQVISGPPASWMAFRVWEFMADPPILDLNWVAGGQLQPVLYGATNRSFSVETTDTLDVMPAPWSSAGLPTGTMTNTFRIFPGIPATADKAFFRVKQE